MMKAGRLLKQLASDAPVAVVVTNNITNSPSGIRPSLGQWWSNVATTRLIIKKITSARQTFEHLGNKLVQLLLMKSNKVVSHLSFLYT